MFHFKLQCKKLNSSTLFRSNLDLLGITIFVALSKIGVIIKLETIGGYYTIIIHGLISSGLFYSVHIIYGQSNRRVVFINKKSN
jgi:hypothetical protein